MMGEQLVADGDTVAVGAVIARIEARRRRRGEAPSAADRDPGQSARAPARISSARGGRPTPAEPTRTSDPPHLTLSPAVRRVVLEHHLDPSKIKGTGKDGRLTKDDVLAAAKVHEAEAPAPRRPRPPPPAPAPAAPPRRARRQPASGARSGCG